MKISSNVLGCALSRSETNRLSPFQLANCFSALCHNGFSHNVKPETVNIIWNVQGDRGGPGMPGLKGEPGIAIRGPKVYFMFFCLFVSYM